MSPRARPGRAVLLAGAVLVAVVAILAASGDRDGAPAPLVPPRVEVDEDSDVAGFEPIGFGTTDEEELLDRGRRGYEHVLYEKSPGGVEATAARVHRFAGLIEAAAERHGVSAETLGALVFLESAGRPEVMAGDDPRNATGLAQILPGTAVDLLGMRVDLGRSRALTRAIARAYRRARRARTAAGRALFERRIERLRRQRRRVDERFDPAASLDAAARYLALAQRRFGREDLAIASYHMGIGNLEQVIAAYVAPRRPARTTRETVRRHDISYVRLFYDSSPTRNPRTYRLLASFGDDSRTYPFRLEAAREIRRLAAQDVEELRRRAELHEAKASAEEVLRPEDENEPYEDPEALRDAYEDGELVPLPIGPRRLGYRIDRRMGELARRLGEERALYRGLRKEALAVLLYVAKEVRRIAGGRGALRVTSTVRDREYQQELLARNDQATAGFSLHTTGYAFDIERRYDSRAQARALEYVLERLRALNVIDWVYEPAAIHVTVGPDGERYLPLYDALVEAP